MPKILIGAPVRQQPSILNEFLSSLRRLDKEDFQVDYYFTDDNDDEEASSLLKSFSLPGSITTVAPGFSKLPYHKNEYTHFWNDHLIWKVAEMKDSMIEAALAGAYDALMLIDSDLVLRKGTLNRLYSLGVPIVSEIFWTRWQPEARELPNVWVNDVYNLYPSQRGEALKDDELVRRTNDFLTMLRQPGVYKVGGLGACTLLSRDALEAGVRFREIPNLSFWGEDRHFCIRAAALGIPLHVDTTLPAYHIYRDSELPGVQGYVSHDPPAEDNNTPSFPKQARLVLAMLVKNEASRYLTDVLTGVSSYIDGAVILDDASTDETTHICRRLLAGIESKIVVRPEGGFGNEVMVRKELWELAVSLKPDWILCLDADEVLEQGAGPRLRRFIENPGANWISMRLFDMWSETQYREDTLWNAHNRYFIPLVRFVPHYNYVWNNKPLHCGRMPANAPFEAGLSTDIRIKHMGWARESDRVAKYKRYKDADGMGVYGSLLQYESILDPSPNLLPW